MDYDKLKQIKNSAPAQYLLQIFKDEILDLQTKHVDASLPAPEYKINSLGKVEATRILMGIVKAVDEFEEISDEEKDIDSLYHGQ